jgi:hypothetical protein
MAETKYRSVLARFFTFFDGINYHRDHEFSVEDLNRVTHADVLNFFKFKCFGTPEPNYGDRNLVCACRVETIEYWKKSISYFYRRAGLENKTQCEQITEFMARIKKMEVRGKGQRSVARRSLKHGEFVHLIQMLKRDEQGRATNVHKYGIPAMLCFQFSLICRLDDASQMLAANLQHNDRFPQQALKARMVWSKNVNDQRDAPWQTLLGSLSTTYCVFVNLGIWLELHLGTTPGANLSPYVFGFSHDNTIPSGGDRSKMRASHILGKIFKDPFFRGGKVGTHSIRKFAATHCRNNSISKDDVDARGRWKNTRRITDRYEDPELPFVDIKACLALCQGGACSYIPKPGCITADFVCTYVSTHIEAKYGRAVATVLGNAVLWAIFSSSADMVPQLIRNRVVTAYIALAERLPDGENPIARKRLWLNGDSNTFRLTEVNTIVEAQENNDGEVAGGGVGVVNAVQGDPGPGGLQHFMMIMTAQHTELQRTLIDHVEATREQLELLNAKLNRMQRSFTTFVNQMNRRPHRMLQAAAAAAAAGENDVLQLPLAQPEQPPAIIQQQAPVAPAVVQVALEASLSPSPRTHNVLWEEWEYGIGGRKPASQFTEQESGFPSRKSTYSRRRAFWNLVCRLIRRGHSAQDAINMIYGVYGQNLTVSKILDRIIRDRKNDTWHVTLR